MTRIFSSTARVFLTGASLLACPMFLSGCEMYAPGNLNTEKIQVREDVSFTDVPATRADEDFVRGVAHEYTRHGQGPLQLTVTYDPHNYRNTARMATDKGTSLVKALRAQGVSTVEMDILPVNGQGDESRVLVGYDSYAAQAPAGCKTMPGTEGMAIEPEADYRLGCTIQSLTARQVSNPKHLEGQGNTDPTTDGRSGGNIVDIVRSGAENKPLDGESASGK